MPKKPSCVLCNALSDNGACCPGCKLKTGLSGATVQFRYEGIARSLIWNMKYRGQRSTARYLAGELTLPHSKARSIVCFVPSDGRSRRRRGYDQAEIIAKHYAKINGIDFASLLLRKTHIRQVGLSRVGRFKNVAGNFTVRGRPESRHIILVDDVITTGATISECAKKLIRAGASSVWAVAAAKR